MGLKLFREVQLIRAKQSIQLPMGGERVARCPARAQPPAVFCHQRIINARKRDC
jgi:hypothetical protein